MLCYNVDSGALRRSTGCRGVWTVEYICMRYREQEPVTLLAQGLETAGRTRGEIRRMLSTMVCMIDIALTC